MLPMAADVGTQSQKSRAPLTERRSERMSSQLAAERVTMDARTNSMPFDNEDEGWGSSAPDVGERGFVTMMPRRMLDELEQTTAASSPQRQEAYRSGDGTSRAERRRGRADDARERGERGWPVADWRPASTRPANQQRYSQPSPRSAPFKGQGTPMSRPNSAGQPSPKQAQQAPQQQGTTPTKLAMESPRSPAMSNFSTPRGWGGTSSQSPTPRPPNAASTAAPQFTDDTSRRTQQPVRIKQPPRARSATPLSQGQSPNAQSVATSADNIHGGSGGSVSSVCSHQGRHTPSHQSPPALLRPASPARGGLTSANDPLLLSPSPG